MTIDVSTLFWLSIIVHTVLISVLLVFVASEHNKRKSLLIFPLIAEGVFFLIIFSIIIHYYPPSNFLLFGTILVYSVIIAFVFALEIPGFVLISRHDQKVVNGISRVRSTLVPLIYAFGKTHEEFENASSTNEEYLKETNLFDLVDDFIEYCKQLKNLNEKFWELLLTELTRTIEVYNKRSKHPYPKLIEVLSLTGLSFLIAQFLHILV